MSASRSGTWSRWTSTPAPPPAISASDDASPAAPRSCSDTHRSFSTSSRLASISFLPVNGSPIWTVGPLVPRPRPRAPGSRGRWRRRSRRGRSSRRRGRSGFRSRARATRVTRALGQRRRRTSRSRAGSPRTPRRRPPRRPPSGRRRSCRSGRSRRPRARRRSRASPKRSPSRRAIGRAPMAMMSRRIPPTPVAAPWNGSTADGWLWLSTLNATAWPSPTSMTPAFSPGPWSTAAPSVGKRRSRSAECL